MPPMLEIPQPPAIISQRPAAPSHLVAVAQSDSRIDLTWNDNSNNETGFNIERKTDTTPYAMIDSVLAGVKSYSSTSLSPDTKYYYRVSAYNMSGDSAYSEAFATTWQTSLPPPVGAPYAPSNLEVTVDSATSIRLTWVDESNDEDGFKVERCDTIVCSYIEIQIIPPLGPQTETYTDTTGLLPDTRYYYRLFAWNAAGNSEYSNATYAETPAQTQQQGTFTVQAKLLQPDNTTEMTFQHTPIPRSVKIKALFTVSPADRVLTQPEQGILADAVAFMETGQTAQILNTVSWLPDNKTMIITPSRSLKYATTYYVGLDPTKLAGLNVNTPYGGEFETMTKNDFNGDGFADILVGASGWQGGNKTGAAYLFLGSSTLSGDVTSSYKLAIYGKEAGDQLGYDVKFAGDVNADGYSDIIVASATASQSTGKVYIIYGYGLTANDHHVCSFYSTPLYPQCVLGSEYLPVQGKFLGATISGNTQGSYFGISVSGAGDVNGDGFEDIIIGELGGGKGSAYIFYGGTQLVGDKQAVRPMPDGTGAILDGENDGDWFGYSVSAGDFNGDGRSDVLVGSYYADEVGNDAGAAYIFFASPNGLVTCTSPSSCPGVKKLHTGLSLQANAQFGYSVSSAGDMDSDGKDDIIVGAPGFNSDRGAVFVFYGKTDGASITKDATIISAATNNERFGDSVSSAGRFNNNQYDDIIIGAPLYGFRPGIDEVYHGSLYVFKGGSTRITGDKLSTQNDNLKREGGGAVYYGHVVRSSGDINGDGLDDIQVGAPGTNTSTGKLYIYTGSATLTKPLPAATAWVNGQALNDFLGL
jgi:hypothetical protein